MTVNRKKASEDFLGDIHGGMAEWCKLILKGIPLLNDEGRAVLDSNGAPYMIPPSPAHLNIIRQFLKDNKIDSPETENKVHDVTSSLPDFTDEPAMH